MCIRCGVCNPRREKGNSKQRLNDKYTTCKTVQLFKILSFNLNEGNSSEINTGSTGINRLSIPSEKGRMTDTRGKLKPSDFGYLRKYSHFTRPQVSNVYDLYPRIKQTILSLMPLVKIEITKFTDEVFPFHAAMRTWLRDGGGTHQL